MCIFFLLADPHTDIARSGSVEDSEAAMLAWDFENLHIYCQKLINSRTKVQKGRIRFI